MRWDARYAHSPLFWFCVDELLELVGVWSSTIMDQFEQFSASEKSNDEVDFFLIFSFFLRFQVKLRNLLCFSNEFFNGNCVWKRTLRSCTGWFLISFETLGVFKIKLSDGSMEALINKVVMHEKFYVQDYFSIELWSRSCSIFKPKIER